jgi:hypothetical protein
MCKSLRDDRHIPLTTVINCATQIVLWALHTGVTAVDSQGKQPSHSSLVFSLAKLEP